MAEISGLASLESAKYLFLRGLSEPRDNCLRVVVEEAVVNHTGSVRTFWPESSELGALLKDARPIESTDACRTFELTWERYVAYLVTEELVGSCGDNTDEVFSGKFFRVYTKSHFLDHLARDTGGYPEPIQHYKLLCENHFIDVASYAPPRINVTGPISSHTVVIQ